MSQITEKDLEYIFQNILKPTDKFNFTCQMCGECCRKRQEPIVVTGLDIFRISQALDMCPFDVLMKYTRGHIGDGSHIPIVVLDERPDGSCKLMRRSRCTVQDNKPIVCAIYPLGRFLRPEDSEFNYIASHPSCLDINTGGQEWTLQEWLDKFNVRQFDAESIAWHSLMLGAAKITARLPLSKISQNVITAMFTALYSNYDTKRNFIEQVEMNRLLLSHTFKKTYGKVIK